MGDPRRVRGKYQGPRHPWNKERIEEEKKLLREYGLVNKKELWKAQSKLTNFKDMTKKLLAQRTEQSEKELSQIFQRLRRLGMLGPEGGADDVLGLGTDEILERRLQTIVYKKGLARTIKQARQFITHGHIAIGSKKVTVPSYLVTVEEESQVGFLPSSSLFREDHPERVVLEKASPKSEEVPVTKTKEENKKESVEEEIKEEVDNEKEVKKAVEEEEADKIVEDHEGELKEKAAEEKTSEEKTTEDEEATKNNEEKEEKQEPDENKEETKRETKQDDEKENNNAEEEKQGGADDQ